MAASKEGLIDNINCKLTTGGLTDIQASQLAGAAQALCCSSFYAVPCAACLPNAALNKGRFVYVQDIANYRYSNGMAWTNDFCSAKVSASLWTWGFNNHGQLGTGDTTSRVSPTSTAGAGANWCQFYSSRGGSFNFSAGIKTDGTLWTWGYNTCGVLGDNSITNRSSPGSVSGGGTTWCVVRLAAQAAAAVKTDGTLWTWGSGYYGLLGTGTSGAGAVRSSPGTTAGGGTNWKYVELSGVALAHGIAVKTDGTLWTWGYNNAGQLGTGNTTVRSSPGTVAGGGSTWCAASAADRLSAAIKTDGTLWTWGLGNTGQLGDGSTLPRSSPGTTAGGGTNWCQVSLGNGFSLAIKTDGTLWSWGYNQVGQLGTGTTTARSSPGTVIGGGTNWCCVSVGQCGTVAAVKTDGSLWMWGCGGNNIFGDGTSTSRLSPVSLAPPPGTSGWKSATPSWTFTGGIASPIGF